MSALAAIASAIDQATGQSFDVASQQQAGGGCINQCLTLAGRDGRRFFIKVNDAQNAEMFKAEAAGLAELAAANAIRVPRPITHGATEKRAFLVLEWLPLGKRGSGAELGRRLADLHRTTWNAFGWWRDNTIGATPQPNRAMPDWLSFFREHRLAHQLNLAKRHGAPRHLVARSELLLSNLEAFFPGYEPIPSLLHGDLWGGNCGFSEGEPVLFDPAIYYGDREADLAMTELFGGFPSEFHAAYREAWPLDPGYRVRRNLYNLYHVLNHFNLFGGSYAAQANGMVEGLLAELR